MRRAPGRRSALRGASASSEATKPPSRTCCVMWHATRDARDLTQREMDNLDRTVLLAWWGPAALSRLFGRGGGIMTRFAGSPPWLMRRLAACARHCRSADRNLQVSSRRSRVRGYNRFAGDCTAVDPFRFVREEFSNILHAYALEVRCDAPDRTARGGWTISRRPYIALCVAAVIF